MKTIRSRVVFCFALGLGCVFTGAPAVFAQETCPVPDGVTPAALPGVTAGDVEAGTGSLQDFALGAVEYSTRVSGDASEAAYVACLTRLEGGPFRSGSIYIISLTPDGRVFFNAKNMATGGRQLDPLIYGAILSAVGIDITNPANIPSQLLEVATTGMFPDPDGGLLPGIGGYAVGYFSISFSTPLISLIGFDLQEEHLVMEEIDSGDPEITADEVVDRNTLKRFVTNAANFMSELVSSGDFSAVAKIRVAFRDPNGPWRHGPVYLFVLDRTGYTIFHGAFPDKFELNTPTTTLRDAVTGELILPQIIETATGSPEGGFVRYHFDNPEDDTDSAEIPKVTYAREATFRVSATDGTTIETQLIVGAGIYGDPVSNDFAHFANGDSITSDLVFVNVAPQQSRPAIYFYDTEGTLVPAESVVDLTEDLEVTEDGALSVRTEMEPLGELTISTHGRGDLMTGSVKVVSEGPIGGMLRFNLPGIGVAGVGASQPVSDAIFPARRQAGGISTAAAIHNLEAEAMMVGCRLMKDGAVLEEVEIPLMANGQDALYIEQMFIGTDTSDFVGSVRCTAPGLFTGIAVELDDGNRIFTTLPVIPVQR